MSGSGCSAGDPALVLGGSTWRDSRRPGSSSTSPRPTPVIPEALAPLLWPRLALCSQPLPAVPPVPAPSSRPADLRESFPDAGTVPCSRLSRCGLPRSRGLARCQAHFPGSARVALPAWLCIPSPPARRLLEYRPGTARGARAAIVRCRVQWALESLRVPKTGLKILGRGWCPGKLLQLPGFGQPQGPPACAGCPGD